jgi:hypothetical protein
MKQVTTNIIPGGVCLSRGKEDSDEENDCYNGSFGDVIFRSGYGR